MTQQAPEPNAALKTDTDLYDQLETDLERKFEPILVLSRWMLVLFFGGLILVLIPLSIHFAKEVVSLVKSELGQVFSFGSDRESETETKTEIWTEHTEHKGERKTEVRRETKGGNEENGEEGMEVRVLTLIDSALIATLVVIVALCGYNNFVSKLDKGLSREDGVRKWLAEVEFSDLKLKFDERNRSDFRHRITKGLSPNKHGDQRGTWLEGWNSPDFRRFGPSVLLLGSNRIR